jgi:hypothetical protein
MSEWWTSQSTAGVKREQEEEINRSNTIIGSATLAPGQCYEYSIITSIDKHNTDGTEKLYTYRKPFEYVGKFVKKIKKQYDDRVDLRLKSEPGNLVFFKDNKTTQLRLPRQTPIFRLIPCPIPSLEQLSRDVVIKNRDAYGPINQAATSVIDNTVGEKGGKRKNKTKKTKRRKITNKNKTKKNKTKKNKTKKNKNKRN